jgi:hypothetical protein
MGLGCEIFHNARHLRNLLKHLLPKRIYHGGKNIISNFYPIYKRNWMLMDELHPLWIKG